MTWLAMSTGEIHHWRSTLEETDHMTWLWISASCGCGVCLGYVGISIQRIISGTSVLVLQNFNKVFLLFLSSVLLGDRLYAMAWVGGILSMGGCIWYGLLRLPSESQEPSGRTSVFTKGETVPLVFSQVKSYVSNHGYTSSLYSSPFTSKLDFSVISAEKPAAPPKGLLFGGPGAFIKARMKEGVQDANGETSSNANVDADNRRKAVSSAVAAAVRARM